MPRLGLRYDLRAPSFGAPAEALYRAALEQCAWADGLGFERVALSEHHGSDDGYCPSPLVMGAAVAARTTRLRVAISALLLTLHHPLRVAEDVAVLDLVSGGRVDLVLGAGYRAEEFAMFGLDMRRRPSLMEEGIAALRQAWTGEPFEFRGATVRVTPRPAQRPGPRIVMGGSSAAAARRAARLADGFQPSVPRLYGIWQEERGRLGLDAPPAPPPGGPLFLHVAEDPDEAWAAIAPHALHETNSYGEWAGQKAGNSPYRSAGAADELRASGMYRVVTPDECVALAGALHPEAVLTLHPLMGGLDPDLAWSSLHLFAGKVLPRL